MLTKFNIIISYIFTFTMLSQSAVSQPVYWEFLNGPAGGLPQNMITAPDGKIYASGRYNGVHNFNTTKNIWENISNYQFMTVFSIAANSKGRIFAVAFAKGIYHTTDNGKKWEIIQQGLPDAFIYSIAINPKDDIFIGTQSEGIYRSTDNGASWIKININNINFLFGSLFLGKNSIKIDTKGYIYVTCIGDQVIRSTDNGNTWTEIIIPNIRASNISNLSFISGNIFISTEGKGIFRSTDDGSSWQEVNSGLNDYYFRMVTGQNTNIFAGSGQNGIYYSNNSGLSWVSKNAGLNSSIINSGTTAANGDVFIGTYGDGIYLLKNNSESWIRTEGFIEMGIEAPIFDSSEYAYIPTDGSGVVRFSKRTKEWKQLNQGLDNKTILSMFKCKNGDFLAGNKDNLYRSTDKGHSWNEEGDRFYTKEARIMTQNKEGDIFAYFLGGGLNKSTDNGKTWELIGFEDKYIYDLEFDSKGNIYFLLIYKAVYFYSSIDKGKTWNISQLFPSITDANIAVDSRDNIYLTLDNSGIQISKDRGKTFKSSDHNFNGKKPYFLYAAPDDKIFTTFMYGGAAFSSDYGTTWTDISKDFEKVQINGFSLNPDGYLYAGTLNAGLLRSITPVTGIANNENQKYKFALEQNYPNPFNPSTVISFEIEAQNIAFVQLKIYDILGREVKSLINENRAPGNHSIVFDAKGLAGGTYFYKLSANGRTEMKKMLLLR